jgi:hypothetical protein
MGAIFFWSCRHIDRTISLSPNRVIAGIGDVTLHVLGREFVSGMTLRVGERILPAQRVSGGELTCTLPRESLLLKESGAETEAVAVCVIDAKGNEYSEPASLSLVLQYTWESGAVPPALDAGSGGPRLFALGRKTLLLVGRNTNKEILGAVSSDSGKTWGAPAVLHAGEATDGAVRFAAHPTMGIAAVIVTTAGIVFRPLVGADGGKPVLPAAAVPRTSALLIDLSVYCDRQGGLHMAWLDSHPMERFTFHYAFSADGGANWSEPRQIREVINSQPEAYTLDYGTFSIEGADGKGNIYLTSLGSFHYRTFCESMLSRDSGETWTVKGIANRVGAGSAVSVAGTLAIGGTLIFGGYYPGINTATLGKSADWETDWQELQFLGADWDKSKPSGIACLRGDHWDNLLIAAFYNQTSDQVMTQAFFRSADAGASWGPKALWPEGLPLLTNLADLAIDPNGSAFALFRKDSGWLLFRALAYSE